MGDALFEYAMQRLRLNRHSLPISCKICDGPTTLFDLVDFNKSCADSQYPLGLCAIPVAYRKCTNCQFISTDFFEGFTEEQWRMYIYNDDYIKVDPDYQSTRPFLNAVEISSLLAGMKDRIVGLDFGGGNGTTAKLLRENGWCFDSYDPFGQTDVSPERVGRYNFCSAIEVFEHLQDPVGALREIIEKSTPERLIILIGTQVSDGFVSEQSRLSWWYAAPRNGHASLYSRKALTILGEKFGLKYSCARGYPHLLTRGFGKAEAHALLLRGKLRRRFRQALARMGGPDRANSRSG